MFRASAAEHLGPEESHRLDVGRSPRDPQRTENTVASTTEDGDDADPESSDLASGSTFGWHHPHWAAVAGSRPEPWHFEFAA
jgi:hypothetical protein